MCARKLIGHLKPDLFTARSFIVIAVVLSSVEWWWISHYPDYFYYQGLPLPVYYWGGFAGLSKTLIFSNLVIDCIIWYLGAVLLVSSIRRLRARYRE